MPPVRQLTAHVALILGACAALVHALPAHADVAQDAARICPVLTGSPVPSVTVRDVDGAEIDLAERVAEKPTLLVFYRGGWCPFCNRQLGALQAIADDLVAMGFQIVALSPDRPEVLPSSVEKHGLSYELLSDSKMSAARAFGLAFRLADEQYERLKGFGHDLEADSGETHHELPVPAAFIVGTDGLIRFSYVNPNYKVRVDAKVLLAAAAALKAEPGETP